MDKITTNYKINTNQPWSISLMNHMIHETRESN